MHEAAVSIWLAAFGAVPHISKLVVDVLQHRQTKREWRAREAQKKKDEKVRKIKKKELSYKEGEGNDDEQECNKKAQLQREGKAEQEREKQAQQDREMKDKLEREKQERERQDEIDREWLARVGLLFHVLQHWHCPSSLSSHSSLRDGTQAKEEGNAYFKDQKFEEAIKCYSKSIDQLRTAAAYGNRATAYFKLNKFIEAEKDCTEALKIDDRYFKAYARRAMARTKLVRNLRGALRDVEVALELVPNSQEMKDLRSELNLVLG